MNNNAMSCGGFACIPTLPNFYLKFKEDVWLASNPLINGGTRPNKFPLPIELILLDRMRLPAAYFFFCHAPSASASQPFFHPSPDKLLINFPVGRTDPIPCLR